MTENEGIIDRILTAVAYREQCEVIELNPPLYRTVDPDSLEEVIESEGVDRVEFGYLGYQIVVDGDGRVHVPDAEAVV